MVYCSQLPNPWQYDSHSIERYLWVEKHSFLDFGKSLLKWEEILEYLFILGQQERGDGEQWVSPYSASKAQAKHGL